MITGKVKDGFLPIEWLAVKYEGLLVLSAVGLAVLAILLPPYYQEKTKLIDADGYQYAMENFARGIWVVSEADIKAKMVEYHNMSPYRIMYVSLENGQWAFRKSPGYPLLALPFQKLGWPRAANALLLIAAAGALYFAFKAWRGSRTALLAVLIFLFTPMTLRAAYFSTMDTFASGALLLIAGSLLILYRYRGVDSGDRLVILFAAGLAGGWGMITRIHSTPIMVLLVGFALFTAWTQAQGNRRRFIQAAAVVLAGLAISLSVWLIYNQVVFGRPLATGYAYHSPFQGLFLWEDKTITEIEGRQLWYVQPSVRTLLSTLIEHLGLWFEPLMRGWPLLPMAFAAFLLAAIKRQLSALYWLCFIWLAATYALYAGIVYFGITFELTIPYFRGQGFFGVDRYLFPAALPITLLTTVFLVELRRELLFLVLIIFIGASLVSFGRFVL